MAKIELEYNGEYTTTIGVTVYWRTEEDGTDGYLLAYEDGDMQDGFDYSEYEERIVNGESFELIAEEIIEELRDSR